MENLASLFALPLALVAEDVNGKQKALQALTHTEANQKESTTDNGSAKPMEADVPHATGEIKLNNDHREVGGNKTSPKKKKKKKKQNKGMQVVHGYIDHDKKTAEEAHLLNSSQWMWNDVSASATRNHEFERASSFQREIVCYDELTNSKIFRKNARWRGKPGHQEGPDKSDLASGDVLPSVQRLTEAPSPSVVESILRTDTVSLEVESNGLSSASSEKKVHEYVDYDKKLVDDAEMHDPFARRWTKRSAAAASNHDNGARPSSSSSQQREIISYEELLQPGNFSGRGQPRGMGQNFHLGLRNPGNGVPGGAFKRPPSHFGGPSNKIPRLIGSELMTRNHIPLMRPLMMIPCGFVDPNVAATEKKEIFAMPQPVVDPNVPKPMSSKKRRKMAQAKFYKEKLRQQQEKEKNRILNDKKSQCRFFSYGSCTKGDDCPFSHDFVPQKRPELCKFYIMNTCERGSNCVYYHNDWPCKFFHVFHSCMQGDACRFSHHPLTEETRLLLEKSMNDGVQICDPSSKPLEFKQPNTGQDSPPLTTIKEGTQGIIGENILVPVPFYGVENVQHTQAITGQVPPDTSDPGFDPIHQDPWNHKLEPIDLDETHRPQLPSGVQSGDPTLLEDPRTERYRTAGKPSERSILRGTTLVKSEPVVIGYDLDSKLSASDLKSIHNGFISEPVFLDTRGAFPDLSSLDSTAKSKKDLRSSSSVSTSLMSQMDNSNSGELRMKTARHLSLPLTRHVARGVGNGGLARNGAARMGTTSNGRPVDPALPEPPLLN